ncbi:MAG: flagellar motor switch protein FliN [Alphaproteobacteria bacterium]|nr:flagellar motor switch protein FliN [Alphaproteobacteria bacterium]
MKSERIAGVQSTIKGPPANQLAFASLENNGEGTALETATDETPAGVTPARLDLVMDVPVWLSVELGRTETAIREVVGLSRGSVIELDRGPGAPLDVRVNGVLIGRGEIVLINEERLGLRFLEVVSPSERVKGSD